MRGTVTHINRARGMIAVEIADGSFTILETLDSAEVSPGDVLSGNLQALGSEIIKNTTTGEEMDVIVQNFDVPHENLRVQLRIE